MSTGVSIYQKYIEPRISNTLQATAILRGLGLWKIPLLFAVRPKVLSLTDEEAIVEIRLFRNTKNHLGTMYFGALAIGADAVVGILAVHHMKKSKHKGIHLSFKDFKADFKKRPDGNVHFVCKDGKNIEALVNDVIASKERRNLTVPAYAYVPSKSPEPVAEFELTLSLKCK